MKFANIVRALSLLAVVAVLATATQSAEAGLFGCLKKKCCEPACCEPEPTCCEPEPVCCEPAPVCEPEPVCCEPEPVCEPAPAPCCEPEPVCCEPEPTCCDPCDPCCKPKKMGFFARLKAKCAAKRAAKCCPAPAPACGC